MRRSAHFVSAGVGFLLFVAALAVATQKTSHGQAQGKDVVVTNTAANPVPTQAVGTTTVTLSSGATVGVNPLLNIVRVATSAAAPLFVRSTDDAARQIFQTQVAVSIPDGSSGEHEIITVPSGKRLVIEHVSGSAIVPEGQKLLLQILTTVGGQQVQHVVQSQSNGPTGSIEVYAGSHAMRVYGDPSSTVLFQASRPESTGVANALIAISGYYVDVP